MPALHLTSSDFNAKVLQSDMPVLVDFFAQWCGPCQMAAPIVDKMADDYEGKVVVAKVDVDENQELAQQFGVMSIPTMIVFKNGKEVDRKIGFPGEAGLKALVENYL